MISSRWTSIRTMDRTPVSINTMMKSSTTIMTTSNDCKISTSSTTTQTKTTRRMATSTCRASTTWPTKKIYPSTAKKLTRSSSPKTKRWTKNLHPPETTTYDTIMEEVPHTIWLPQLEASNKLLTIKTDSSTNSSTNSTNSSSSSSRTCSRNSSLLPLELIIPKK
jgi:hypothetical protein